jgi:glycosyltransferase involved in cell wall biosynthesis
MPNIGIILPRFHSNMRFWLHELQTHDFGVYLYVLESNERLQHYDKFKSFKLNVIGYIYSKKFKSRFLNFVMENLFIPNLLQLRNCVRNDGIDCIILRSPLRIYAILIIFFCKIYSIPLINYMQEPQYRSRRKKCIFFVYKLLSKMNFNFITPVEVIGGKENDKIALPGVTYIPFKSIISSNQDLLLQDSNILKLVAIGKMEKRKRHFELLEVMRRILNKFPSQKFYMYIIGELTTLSHEVYYRELLKFINDKELHEVVKVKLNISNQEVLEILKRSDILISNSVNEPAGFSIVEGMAAGLCVLSVENQGTSSYIDNELNGFLFNPNDDSLFLLLSKLISHSERLISIRQAALLKSKELGKDNLTKYLKCSLGLLK